MKKVDALQGDLEQVREELLCPESVAKHLGELRRGIATGQEILRYYRFLLDILALDCVATNVSFSL